MLPLTPRQKEVMTHISQGEKAKEVGRALGISPRTVEALVHNILERLGAKNTPHAVAMFVRDVS